MPIFRNLIGKSINGIFIGNDNWTIVFRTNEGKYFRYDTQNDCCNSVWINHISGVSLIGEGNIFDIMAGVVVTGAEDKGWTENRFEEDGHEAVQDGFFTLHTERGYIDFEVRNSHNGYYGGSFDAVTEVDLDSIKDLTEVKEDF